MEAEGCTGGSSRTPWAREDAASAGFGTVRPRVQIPSLRPISDSKPCTPIVDHYSQMCSSAIAPSCHLANVTIRLPFSSSPTTQVQSPGTSIDWVDLVQFHGVTYVADWTLRGRPIQQGDLGSRD